MTSDELDTILAITPKDEISYEQKRYIELCKDDQEIRGRYFKKGDFFFHEDYGLNTVSRDQNNGEFLSRADPICPILAEESIWLPTVKQIKDLFCDHGLEHQIEHFHFVEDEEKNQLSLSVEEKWLRYYFYIAK